MNIINSILSHASRSIAFIAGAVIGVIEPAMPYMVICFFAIVLDMISAWRLSIRVKQKHNTGDGKLKSLHVRKVFLDFMVICALIVLCYYIDKEIIVVIENLYLANVVAAGFALNQVLSILENESSCNGATWAKGLQKILVDKTSRHLGINLTKKEDGI